MPRKILAEFLGSLLLAALVIGSGIAAQNLSTDVGLRLLENAAATAAGLYAIILVFGPVSGGHFNPVVSLADAAFGGLTWREAAAYVPAQVAGCVSGAVLANVMFELPPVSVSATHRATLAHGVSEIVATLGLILVVFALVRSGRVERAPAAVGAYIGAAYWFTFDSHRALPFESVRTAITVANTGGANDAGPRWAARFCHWNIDVTNGRSHAVRLEEHAPHSAMIGIRGTTGPTDHPREFGGELSSVVDALDERVAPGNLYEAQLRARLG